jgi:hypothetical protein
MNGSGFSPKALLRSRRPERFSDSVLEDPPILDRSMLEYHLQSLTSRSQEQDFEEFARHLAEKELSPNLIPHTGPTGGGDSKVDSETYPVADQLSMAWFTGLGREGASERWAFAFSAKKTWRGKVQSDIKKIAATRRGYRKAFLSRINSYLIVLARKLKTRYARSTESTSAFWTVIGYSIEYS